MKDQLCTLTRTPHRYSTEHGVLRIPGFFLLACSCGEIGYFEQDQQREAA